MDSGGFEEAHDPVEDGFFCLPSAGHERALDFQSQAEIVAAERSTDSTAAIEEKTRALRTFVTELLAADQIQYAKDIFIAPVLLSDVVRKLLSTLTGFTDTDVYIQKLAKTLARETNIPFDGDAMVCLLRVPPSFDKFADLDAVQVLRTVAGRLEDADESESTMTSVLENVYASLVEQTQPENWKNSSVKIKAKESFDTWLRSSRKAITYYVMEREQNAVQKHLKHTLTTLVLAKDKVKSSAENLTSFDLLSSVDHFEEDADGLVFQDQEATRQDRSRTDALDLTPGLAAHVLGVLLDLTQQLISRR